MEVGLSAWTIQDGNYPEFEVGQVVSFALEFSAALGDIEQKEKAVVVDRIAPGVYEGCARVIFSNVDLWILDFGSFRAYEDYPPRDLDILNSFIHGKFFIEVDPFPFFETFRHIPGVPDIRSNWKISSIQLETTPWIKNLDASQPEILRRDESKLGYRSVQRTNAWEDDGGNAHYILECCPIS